MRQMLFVAAFLFCMQASTFVQAQEAKEPNPVIVTTWMFTPPENGDTTLKGVNVDSLVMYYIDKGVRPNELIKNFRILTHYWGDDNFKILFIYEIEGFGNIPKASNKISELIDASFKKEADKNLFWKRWDRIFNRHEDSIMANWGTPKM